MRIGYLGLGVMGGALARRLRLSRDVVVFDIDKDAVARFAAEGCATAASAGELAQSCDTIFLCLPTSAHVRQAIFGADGLAATLKPGAMLIDQTTGDPHETRAMADELAPRGVELIDAPVSGGAIGAQAGTIAIMVGASAAQFARIEPVLKHVSPNIFHAGEVGAGHVIKLVNNMISHAQRLLTQEGMTLAARNGLDPDRAAQILLASGGRNAYMEKVLAPRVLRGKLAIGFTLGLAHKDIALACDVARRCGVPTPIAAQATALYSAMVAERGHDAEVEVSGLIAEREAGARYIPVERDL
ncbi:MAG: NAD(P)-dependent oxidoreductase [Methylobacteriaceae bacterium]|nr:NAD(P)-dependent oxidoreductase [Methylobacteriaceae bacterium]